MNNALVYISAIGFLIAIFPVHVINYVYVSTGEKYASVNVTLYRLVTIINLNTDKTDLKIRQTKPKKKQIMTPANWLKIYNKLCITKITQVSDFGLLNPDNAYLALLQNAASCALYTFVRANGGRTKLKNFTVLNYEHDKINYYLKLTGIINVMTLLRLFSIFIWGKINERKIKEKQ